MGFISPAVQAKSWMVFFCTEQGKNDNLNSNLGSSGPRIREKVPAYLQESI
jgi:hypothetical protein